MISFLRINSSRLYKTILYLFSIKQWRKINPIPPIILVSIHAHLGISIAMAIPNK